MSYVTALVKYNVTGSIPKPKTRLNRNYEFELKTIEAVKMPKKSICSLAFSF